MSVALIATTETSWVSVARMPSALRAAGFKVAVVAPPDALVLHSSHLDYVARLNAQCSAEQWLYNVQRMAEHTSARIILPGDDRAFRLLASRVLESGAAGAAGAKAPPDAFSALIAESCGNPAHYLESVDKLALPDAAARLGVAMPSHEVVSSIDAARNAAARLGFPLLVKRQFGAGGTGVRTVADEATLLTMVSEWLRPTPDLFGPMRQAVLMQQAVPGQNVYYAVAAWRGKLLAGWAAQKLAEHPKNGPGTVSRSHRSDAVRQMTARIVEGLDMSGVFGCEFIVPENGAAPVLIEINRRIAPSSCRGRMVKVDLLGALHAALRGEAFTGRTDFDVGEEHISVFFPQELARDPASEYMRKYPVEVPWDDPALALVLFESVM